MKFLAYTAIYYLQLGCESIRSHSSVQGKTTLITGSVGRAGAGPNTNKIGTYFHTLLAPTMPISNNFQLKRASGETSKLLVLHNYNVRMERLDFLSTKKVRLLLTHIVQ